MKYIICTFSGNKVVYLLTGAIIGGYWSCIKDWRDAMQQYSAHLSNPNASKYNHIQLLSTVGDY